MPQVYEGDRPYIFMNYAHADRTVVLPIIRVLANAGYRVWYDDGIQGGAEFPEYIADRIHDCACFVMFVSRASLESNWCRREVYYALDCGKTIVPVYLEDVELTRGLSMSIGKTHALFWHELDEAAFYGKLFKTGTLNRCLTDEGRRQRALKQKNNVPEQEPLEEVSVKGVGSTGVVPKNALIEYSWNDLKRLSRAIASAASDERGLEIASAYGLANQDGGLLGNEKYFQLLNKKWVSVRIIGFRHDEVVGGGKAGISFEFTSAPVKHDMNLGWTNVGGWEKSEMRKWLNEDFSAILPDDLKSRIAMVTKRTNNKGFVEGEDDIAVVTSTPETLWLLSMVEVYGTTADQTINVPRPQVVYDLEGSQYQRYAERQVTTVNYSSFRRDGGASTWWWLRSPSADTPDRFHAVHGDGGWNSRPALRQLGVSPCFCF